MTQPQESVVEIDVGPALAEQFRKSHPCRMDQEDRHGQALTFGGVEDRDLLRAGERLALGGMERGPRTGLATLRGINPHSTACPSAIRSTA